MILPYHLPLQGCDKQTRDVSEEPHSSQQGKGTHPWSDGEVSDTNIPASFTRAQRDVDFPTLQHEFPLLILDDVQGKDLHNFLLHSCAKLISSLNFLLFFFLQ